MAYSSSSNASTPQKKPKPFRIPQYGPDGQLLTKRGRPDGRASPKERKRRSKVARSIPRGPDGKFRPVPIGYAISRKPEGGIVPISQLYAEAGIPYPYGSSVVTSATPASTTTNNTPGTGSTNGNPVKFDNCTCSLCVPPGTTTTTTTPATSTIQGIPQAAAPYPGCECDDCKPKSSTAPSQPNPATPAIPQSNNDACECDDCKPKSSATSSQPKSSSPVAIPVNNGVGICTDSCCVPPKAASTTPAPQKQQQQEVETCKKVSINVPSDSGSTTNVFATTAYICPGIALPCSGAPNVGPFINNGQVIATTPEQESNNNNAKESNSNNAVPASSWTAMAIKSASGSSNNNKAVDVGTAIVSIKPSPPSTPRPSTPQIQQQQPAAAAMDMGEFFKSMFQTPDFKKALNDAISAGVKDAVGQAVATASNSGGNVASPAGTKVTYNRAINFGTNDTAQKNLSPRVNPDGSFSI